MGTAKKEKSRRQRDGEAAKGAGAVKTGNLKVKGENFYRDAQQARKLAMYKEGRATRNARGEITIAAKMQSTELPRARVEPNRRWFGNTRVISQDALTHFREAVKATQNDSYQVLLRRNKLPMSLLEESTKQPQVDITETESYASTFGPKAQRKKPRVALNTLDDLATMVVADSVRYEEKQEEKQLLGGGEESEYSNAAKDSIFSKGQSKRIWNELYKVIDSSDVVIHVLDARDPIGTRCRSVEQYLKKEAPHKHLVFVLNKCDLVPTWVSVSYYFFQTPLLSQGAGLFLRNFSAQQPVTTLEE